MITEKALCGKFYLMNSAKNQNPCSSWHAIAQIKLKVPERNI